MAPIPCASGPRRASLPCGLAGREAVNDFGQMQEVRLTGIRRRFWRAWPRAAVYHFEVTRPSLQDIFVRIAKP